MVENRNNELLAFEHVAQLFETVLGLSVVFGEDGHMHTSTSKGLKDLVLTMLPFVERLVIHEWTAPCFLKCLLEMSNEVPLHISSSMVQENIEPPWYCRRGL
jgi:hypothetical protein